MNGSRIKGSIFIAVGLGLLIMAIVTGVRVDGFVRDATSAEGVVVRTLAGSSHPEIAFTAASGAQVVYPQGGWISGYRTGDRVRVLYASDAPSKSPCLDVFGALWFVPTLLGGLSLFFILGGVLLRKGTSARKEMSPRVVTVDTVLRRQAGQVAVHIAPPDGIDLQFIYRAGLGIYWNPAEALLEDRSSAVESSETSADRMARALREEYGIVLQASANVRWKDFGAEEQNQIASILFG